jgi:hypothetical protein
MQRNEFTWNVREAERKMRLGALLGISQWAELLLQKSREEVPLDEATLERSGVASTDEETLTAAVAYDTPYAVAQHENMQYTHAPGRKAKYLEDPWNASADTAGDLIAANIRRAMR